MVAYIFWAIRYQSKIGADFYRQGAQFTGILQLKTAKITSKSLSSTGGCFGELLILSQFGNCYSSLPQPDESLKVDTIPNNCGTKGSAGNRPTERSLLF